MITVAAGNTPRKRRLRHPREQARYIARRLHLHVDSFSTCEMGTGLRHRLRGVEGVRVVAPRANAVIRRFGRVVNKIGNGVIVNRDTLAVEDDDDFIRFPWYRDRFVDRGLFWPVVQLKVRETGQRYNHCSAHVPTRSRLEDGRRVGMIDKAARELERRGYPAVLSGDFNGSPDWVRGILGDGWRLAERKDVIMIWVHGFRVVGRDVDVTVEGKLTDHGGFCYAQLEPHR